MRPAAARPTVTAVVDAVRGASSATRQTPSAAITLTSPDRPTVVYSANSVTVPSPMRCTGRAAVCAASTIRRTNSASSQPAPHNASGPAAARASSARNRVVSSSGTAARPTVPTAVMSASARTSGPVTAPCG